MGPGGRPGGENKNQGDQEEMEMGHLEQVWVEVQVEDLPEQLGLVQNLNLDWCH